jgi:hypothetical protein
MTLFDISDSVSIDIEKIEAIILDNSTGQSRLLCCLSSGRDYLVSDVVASELFSKLRMLERGDGASKQYVSL